MTSLIPLLLTGLLLGQPGPGMGPRAGGPPQGRQAGLPADITPFMDRVAEAVKATPEQIEKLKAIAAEHKTAAEAARTARQEQAKANEEQLRTLHEQMREARKAGDDQKVSELHGQIRALMGSPRGDLMRETRAKITAILTDEQKTAFEEFLAKDRKGLRQHVGQPGPAWGPRGQGPNIYQFIERVIETVEATDEQKTQLQVIAGEHIRALKATEADREIAMQTNREQIETLRRQMRDAHKAGNTEQVTTLRKQLEELTGTPIANVLKVTQEKIAAILTAEQKAKYEALMEEMKANSTSGDRNRQKLKGGKAGPHRGERGRRGPAGGSPPLPPTQGDDAA
ncbi:MAG: Spy/CpxP family protein refolding chaperone [Phycisphaerae bacterium]|nr:Spy/CpxP family protein refolding chaperone [Phycisphaerae bacterium]